MLPAEKVWLTSTQVSDGEQTKRPVLAEIVNYHQHKTSPQKLDVLLAIQCRASVASKRTILPRFIRKLPIAMKSVSHSLTQPFTWLVDHLLTHQTNQPIS